MAGATIKIGVFTTLLPLGACYTFAPASLDSVALGAQVKVNLTEEGFGRVANQAALNGFPVAELDFTNRGVVGRVRTLEPDELAVELRGVGAGVFVAELPTRTIQAVALRRFHAGRTAGAVAAGAAAFLLMFESGIVGGAGDPETPPEPPALVTWLRLTIR